MGANIAPNGLFGWLNPTTARPARNIYAWDDTTATWLPATWVYAWVADPAPNPTNTGRWEVIWGATIAPPTTVTATYQASDTSVLVSWQPPTPAAGTSWIVSRADGSIVGTVPLTTTQLRDPTPRPGDQVYSVAATDGQTTSAKTHAGAVSIDPHATTATATRSGNNVVISWSGITNGEPDQWRVYNRTTRTWATNFLAGSTRSVTIPAPTAGLEHTFAVGPFMAGIQGPTSAVAPDVAIPANPPTNVKLAKTSTVGQLTMTWSHPAGSRTGYEWQWHDGSWHAGGTVGSSTTSRSHTDPDQRYMRVRTLSNGGASSWVQVGPVTPLQDQTPPAKATITSWKPESSYGRLVVRGTMPADADVTGIRIYAHRIGDAWGNPVHDGPANPSQTFSRAAITGATAGNTYEVQIRAYDANGNYSFIETTYTMAAQWVNVDPDSSATWRTNEWRSDATAGATDVMHGRTSSGENIGCYFYGNKLHNAMAGKTVLAAIIEYCRDGSSQGAGQAIQPGIQAHNHGTRPSGAPTIYTNGQSLGGGVARSGTTANEGALSTTAIGHIAGAANRGIALYRATSDTNPSSPGSYYMRIFPANHVAGGKRSGRVRIQTLG